MKQGEAALGFHEATKHNEVNVRTSGHFLDWEDKPKPFKVYTDTPVTPLPLEFPRPRLNALLSVDIGRSPAEAKQPTSSASGLGVETLAELLYFSGGITREIVVGRGTRYFMRAAPATGALYPIELYLVCGDLEGLDAGVYHFGPGDFSLSRLRSGDWRVALSSYAGGRLETSGAALSIVLTSMAWRNAWKYEARSYRHWFWDGGAIAANLLATARAAGLAASVGLGFEDEGVNRLLGLREREEAAIAIVDVADSGRERYQGIEGSSQRAPGLPPKIDPPFARISQRTIQYPQVWQLHEASYLHGSDAVRAWVEGGRGGVAGPKPVARAPDRQTFPLRPSLPLPDDPPSLAEVILKRGSTRRFSRDSISFEKLSNVIYHSTGGTGLDVLPGSSSMLDIFLISNSVDGLPNGSYHYDRASDSLEQLKAGTLRGMSGYLCLGQPLFAGAGAVVFLMADLSAVTRVLGDRGYRAAQFEAGVVVGRMYLAAYSQEIGSSGTTFYDDAVTEFFSPRAANETPMMALGIGLPDYRAKPGKLLPRRLSREQLTTA